MSYCLAKLNPDMMDESGGLSCWFNQYRSIVLSYAEIMAQVSGVLGLFEEAFAKVRPMRAAS